MNQPYWENKYRPTTVCVDSCSNTVLSGRFYNMYLKDGEQFHGLLELLLRMDHLLNEMNFPQNYTSPRTFAREPVSGCSPVISSDFRKGELATFEVRVIFRQHASWQGTVLWLEEKQEENFRSVLELIQLIASALQEKQKCLPEEAPPPAREDTGCPEQSR